MVLLLSIPLCLYAQEPNVLNEVVITAGSYPQQRRHIGQVVQIIDEETLARNEGRSVAELLNQVPGLTIGGNGNNIGEPKSVYLRGASARNTLILIDGVPMNDASGITGEYDISNIPIDEIASIEIAKGPNATLYGSDAVAGVINIITRRTNSSYANLLATAGSYRTWKQAFSCQGSSKAMGFALNFSNLNSGGFSSAMPKNGETNFDKDGFQQQAFALTLNQKFMDQLKLAANIRWNKNQTVLDRGAYMDALDYHSFKSIFFGGLDAELVIPHGACNMRFNQNNIQRIFDDQGATSHYISRITKIETKLNYHPAHFLDIVGGLHHQYSATQQINLYNNLFDANNHISSAYTALFFKIKDRFHAKIGGRYNIHSQYGASFTYTINPSYLLGDCYQFFLNLSSAYSVPSLFQLFSKYGNPALKPEQSTSFEAGFFLTQIFKNANLSCAYFDRRIQDVIEFGQAAYVNQCMQKDRGFELACAFALNSSMRINASYMYVIAASNNLYRRPRNSFAADWTWTAHKKWNFALIYKWTGERKDQYFDQDIARLTEFNLAPYQTLDLQLQYKPQSRFVLFADIQNIFDEPYVEVIGYTTKGIHFNAGIRYHFL